MPKVSSAFCMLSDLVERREDDVVEGELNLRGSEESGEVAAGAGALRLLLRRQPRLQRLDRHRVQRGEEVVQQIGLKTRQTLYKFKPPGSKFL